MATTAQRVLAEHQSLLTGVTNAISIICARADGQPLPELPEKLMSASELDLLAFAISRLITVYSAVFEAEASET